MKVESEARRLLKSAGHGASWGMERSGGRDVKRVGSTQKGKTAGAMDVLDTSALNHL